MKWLLSIILILFTVNSFSQELDSLSKENYIQGPQQITYNSTTTIVPKYSVISFALIGVGLTSMFPSMRYPNSDLPMFLFGSSMVIVGSVYFTLNYNKNKKNIMIYE